MMDKTVQLALLEQSLIPILLWSVLKIRSRRIGLVPTFSRHGSVQASLALLIWLIEKVLPAIETQNVS